MGVRTVDPGLLAAMRETRTIPRVDGISQAQNTTSCGQAWRRIATCCGISVPARPRSTHARGPPIHRRPPAANIAARLVHTPVAVVHHRAPTPGPPGHGSERAFEMLESGDRAVSGRVDHLRGGRSWVRTAHPDGSHPAWLEAVRSRPAVRCLQDRRVAHRARARRRDSARHRSLRRRRPRDQGRAEPASASDRHRSCPERTAHGAGRFRCRLGLRDPCLRNPERRDPRLRAPGLCDPALGGPTRGLLLGVRRAWRHRPSVLAPNRARPSRRRDQDRARRHRGAPGHARSEAPAGGSRRPTARLGRAHGVQLPARCRLDDQPPTSGGARRTPPGGPPERQSRHRSVAQAAGWHRPSAPVCSRCPPWAR